MITEIKRSKTPVALLADTIDRVQRSFKDSVLLDELRLSGKVVLHFIRENLIINKNSNSADILRWDMGVMFAKSYVTQLSDNVKRGLEQKRLNGEWTGHPSFGYKTVTKDDGKSWIVPDETRAPAVLDMFRWYASASYSLKLVRASTASRSRRRTSTAFSRTRFMPAPCASVAEGTVITTLLSLQGKCNARFSRYCLVLTSNRINTLLCPTFIVGS